MEEEVMYDIDPRLVTFPIPTNTLVATCVDAFSSPCSSMNIDNEEVCSVCLEHLHHLRSEEDGGGNDVQEEVGQLLHNCHHAFHKGCLEDLVAGGHLTCPICRANFLLAAHPNPKGDPWRLERMIYLFGHDFCF